MTAPMKVYKDWEAIAEVDIGSKQKAYLCEDGQGEQKVLWWPDTLDYKAKDRFKKKIERIKGLSNPYIAKVYDIVHDEEAHKDIAFAEYCPGEPIFLASVMLTLVQKLRLLIHVLRGLEFIHKNDLLHLNIKSDNVYAELVSLHAKIINWGAALPMDATKELAGKLVGTPAYMAPEIALGPAEKIGRRADLFSWAVLAYQVLSGTFPFPERVGMMGDANKLREVIGKENEPQYIKNVPDNLNAVVCGMLKKRPEDRIYQNAKDTIKALSKDWPEAAAKKLHPSCDVLKTKLDLK